MVPFVFHSYHHLLCNAMMSLLLYKSVKILSVLGYFNQEDNMLIISFDDVVTGSGRGTHNVVIFGVQKQGIGVTRGHVPELTEVVGVHTCIIQHVLDIGGPTETRVYRSVFNLNEKIRIRIKHISIHIYVCIIFLLQT